MHGLQIMDKVPEILETSNHRTGQIVCIFYLCRKSDLTTSLKRVSEADRAVQRVENNENLMLQIYHARTKKRTQSFNGSESNWSKRYALEQRF